MSSVEAAFAPPPQCEVVFGGKMPSAGTNVKSVFHCKWTLYFLAYFVCITRSFVFVVAAAEDGNCPFPSVPFAARDGRIFGCD